MDGDGALLILYHKVCCGKKRKVHSRHTLCFGIINPAAVILFRNSIGRFQPHAIMADSKGAREKERRFVEGYDMSAARRPVQEQWERLEYRGRAYGLF